MTIWLIRLYYFATLYTIAPIYPLFNKTLPPANYLLFARPLQGLLQIQPTLSVIFYLGLLSLFSNLIRTNFISRLVSYAFILLLLSIKFSYAGKVSHDYFVWFISGLLVCFLSPNQTFIETKNARVLKLTQAVLLSHYFSAGLWKLRHIDFQDWKLIPLEYISYAIAEGQSINRYIQQFLLDQPSLFSIGFLLIILFQISTLVPIISGRHLKLWGGFALVFHLTVGFSMGIWFQRTMITILLFFFVPDLLSLREKLLSPNSP